MKFSMFFKIICSVIMLIMFAFFGYAATGTAETKTAPTVNYYGVFDKDEMVLLRPAFINTVNNYLRKYNPRLLEQSQKYVKITAKYKYELDIELFVKEEISEKEEIFEYEIVVTAANNYNSKAQRICTKIGGEIYRRFTNELIRGTRVRDRTGKEGTR